MAMNPENKALAERINAKLAGTGKSLAYNYATGHWRVSYLDGSKPRLIDDLAALEAELAGTGNAAELEVSHERE